MSNLNTQSTNATAGCAPATDSPLVMNFIIEGAGKIIKGTMDVPDDDGTTHMPMMIWGLLKQVVQDAPEICGAHSMRIIATFNPVNGPDQATAKKKL